MVEGRMDAQNLRHACRGGIEFPIRLSILIFFAMRHDGKVGVCASLPTELQNLNLSIFCLRHSNVGQDHTSNQLHSYKFPL